MKITKHGIAVIEGDECISKWVEQSGRLDHDLSLVPRVLKHIKEGDTVIDCGAFIGDHTIAYSRQVGDSGRVLAFEPNEASFECLQYNLRDCKNVSLFKAGLGDSNHKASIVDVETNTGMNYFIPGNDIDVITIDSLGLKRLDFLKIDCEGYENKVLIGAQATIEAFKPKMLIEINQMTLERHGLTRDTIYDLLDAFGYTYRNIYPNHGLNEYQMDIFCEPLLEVQ